METKPIIENLPSIIDHLKQLRDEWKDEIPSQVIHSNAKDNRYKCRKGWFVGVAADLSNGLEEDLFPNSKVQREITSFLEWYQNDFARGELTTPEDIKRANRIIDIAVNSQEFL